MTYRAKVIADSLSPAGVRLTTLEIRFPRFILAEFNTHRMFSRNSASSRAIPVAVNLSAIESGDWFMPERFTKNQRGMQASDYVDEDAAFKASAIWAQANIAMTNAAVALAALGVHKQHTNRLLEPFLWHTVIVTATDWNNFFHLRCHPNAQPEMQEIARMMRYAIVENVPTLVQYGEWHLPYITADDRTEEPDLPHLALISSARCARVSYLTHDGKRDIQADQALATKLLSAGDMSPFEHAATPHDRGSGNFRGWMQYRKLIPYEHDILGTRP